MIREKNCRGLVSKSHLRLGVEFIIFTNSSFLSKGLNLSFGNYKLLLYLEFLGEVVKIFVEKIEVGRIFNFD